MVIVVVVVVVTVVVAVIVVVVLIVVVVGVVIVISCGSNAETRELRSCVREPPERSRVRKWETHENGEIRTGEQQNRVDE
jgi:cell division protein FtsW (lipid II flippase)